MPDLPVRTSSTEEAAMSGDCHDTAPSVCPLCGVEPNHQERLADGGWWWPCTVPDVKRPEDEHGGRHRIDCHQCWGPNAPRMPR